MTTTPATTAPVTASAPGAAPVPVDGPVLRAFMRQWATGVAVVTSRTAQRPVGCTVNAFTSISLQPPLVLVSLGRGSRTLAALTTAGRFAVNLLPWPDRHLADRFAADVGDRFAGVDHRLVDAVPVLDRATAVAVCTVTELVPVADHMLVLGTPYRCHEGDPAGDPAVFVAGGYHRVTPD